MAVTQEQNALLSGLLEGYEPAFINFQAMSLSVKKTYTRAYFDAKTDAGREKELPGWWIGLTKTYSPCKSWNGSQCLQKAARKYFWKRGL